MGVIVCCCDRLSRFGLLVLTFSAHVLCQFPGPCTDLMPLYLLQFAIPDHYHLPPGVEIVYDNQYSVHGYRFTSDIASSHFMSSNIFKFCHYFPEEFSFLITFKISDRTEESDECIFSLIKRGTQKVIIGIRLFKGRLQFDYEDRLTKSRRVTEFGDLDIDEDSWHTLILTVTGGSISLRMDCGPPQRKRLKRIFPALINTRNTNIHIGHCNRQGSAVFSGILKELILLPGSDIGTEACPSSKPEIPDIGSPTHPSVPYPPSIYTDSCTWRDTGKLNFDVYRKVLQVCYSGVWQPILLPPADEPKRERMDYVEWHQDIITAAPTIDIEIFRVPDEGLFLAAASFDSTNLKKQQSAILKWDDGNFRVYQSLYTLGAQSWEHFQVGKKFFLAVANMGAKRDKPSKSVIYKWSRRRRRFELYQELVTWTARDIEYFQIENEHYLAVANHVRGQNHSIESVIMQWSATEKKFEPIQEILTVGGYDWTHFKVDGYHFLVVANSYSGPPQVTTKLNSVIYFWQGGVFLPFQSIETTGATDWEYFTMNGEFYLVVANAFNYGSHISNITQRYETNSTIYRLNIIRKKFEVYQNIVTYSAVDWEYFTIGTDHYLIVSNAQQDGATSFGHVLATTRSVIYRWQGVEKFVPVHYLESLPSADWEVFHEGGSTYLVYANAKDNISQVYKVKLV